MFKYIIYCELWFNDENYNEPEKCTPSSRPHNLNETFINPKLRSLLKITEHYIFVCYTNIKCKNTEIKYYSVVSNILNFTLKQLH